MTIFFKRGRLLAFGVLAVAFGATPRAEACGGTFCDSATAMPVEQTGENILFALDNGFVEAHIQIQYQGDAAKFAWLIPLPAVPELRVGSQPLFANLLNATVPLYGFNTNFGCSMSGGGLVVNGGGGVDFPPSVGEGPRVVLEQTVGAFDVVVLQGGTTQEVSDWLVGNGYQNIPTAPEILDSYVARDYVFAAIKLTNGAGIDEIHPLVVRYPGSEPCVPLKLTAVAAVENMGVRAFFLGSQRVVPTNYKHIELNPARLDWMNFGDNYQQVVSRAVDSAVADGRAFLTEYAGQSGVVSRNGIYDPNWSAAAFLNLAPELVVEELTQQGLATCDAASCTFSHPLLLPMLREFVPVPADTDEGAFYSCMACYANQIDSTIWNGAEGDIAGRGFAEAFQERIIVPGRDARDLLDFHPYLTRLYTTISPAEMTEDPTFTARAGLPDVAPRNIATQRLDEEGRAAFELADGRTVVLDAAGNWPEFDGQMPWADTIQEFTAGGSVVELVDNRTLISILLDDWNGQQDYVDPNCGPNGVNGSGGTLVLGNGGSGPRGGAGGAGGASSLSPSGNSEGCGCRTVSRSAPPSAWLLAALLPLALTGRRRAKKV